MPLFSDNTQIMFNGEKSDYHIAIITTTSTNSNTKTLDISSYNLTNVVSVIGQTVKSGTDNTNAPILHIVSFSDTEIQYQLLQSKTTNTILISSVEGLEYDTTTNVTVHFLIFYK